ncbi:MAG: HAMP domain-containing methyl-accepting chemotaxis protein [Polaromonas sp.]|nr:HAMP domain-containing methyl-accepting chemotaxis protein [Polaromonas sp.]
MNLTIRNHLILFGALSALFIALLAGTGLFAVKQLQGALGEASRSAVLLENNLQGDQMHNVVREDVLLANMASRDKDSKTSTSLIAKTAEHSAAFLRILSENLSTQTSPEIRTLLQANEVLVKKYLTISSDTVKAFATDYETGRLKSDEFNAAYATLEKDLGNTTEKIQAYAVATEAKAHETTKSALIAVGVVSVLALALSTLFGVQMFRQITRPIDVLTSVVERVNGGDMTARAKLDGTDELGHFSRAFDGLLDARIAMQQKVEAEKQKAEDENENLNNSVISILQAVNQLSQRDLTAKAPVTQDIIGTVSDSINQLSEETSKVLRGVNLIAAQVAQGSGKVKDQANLMSKTAEDDRKSVGEMIDSLTDATQSMNQVAAMAEQSNRHAEQATQVTLTALETVNGTVKGMESIRETIAETEKRIKRLGERSQEITGIVNLINTISERTHVLALNASMQAAVAGEAGRGFAVVAEEVQRLAESSRNATQQIGTLVGNIQLETNETIATVNRTIGQVVQGSEQAQKAGDQMRQTQQITGELVAQVRLIASSSEQQKQLSAGLLRSVQNIGLSADRTAQQIGVQNQETDTLLESARLLVESVGVFKLPQVA